MAPSGSLGSPAPIGVRVTRSNTDEPTWGFKLEWELGWVGERELLREVHLISFRPVAFEAPFIYFLFPPPTIISQFF